jgi:chemotaxis protein MotB
VVGDRFIFESDVLFATGSAELSLAGRESLAQVAQIIVSVMPEIPDDVDWIIRVDGHTDVVPISTSAFPSNWHLSSARAINVVNFFEEQGIPSRRLVAAGFGEWNPVDTGRSEESLARNRRIELKLDSR